MYKSIKIKSELYEKLLNDGNESFQLKIARLIDNGTRVLTKETVEQLALAYGNNTAKDNLDEFIKSIIIDYKASQMSNLGSWTKGNAPDLMKSGMTEDAVLKCSEFEAFYDADPKAAAMSLYVALKKG